LLPLPPSSTSRRSSSSNGQKIVRFRRQARRRRAPGGEATRFRLPKVRRTWGARWRRRSRPEQLVGARAAQPRWRAAVSSAGGDGLVEELGSKRNLQGTLPRVWISEEMAGCEASTAAGLPVGVAAPAELACTNAGAGRLVLRAKPRGRSHPQPAAARMQATQEQAPALGREGRSLASVGRAPGREGRSASASAGSRRPRAWEEGEERRRGLPADGREERSWATGQC